MSDQLTAAAVRSALDEVTHPEINASLVELGMIDDIRVNGQTVAVDIALPMYTIPDAIKDMLAQRVSQAVTDLGGEPDPSFTLMDVQTRNDFFEAESAQWSGLDGDETPDSPSAPF